ncbi:MAG: hypothetical protein PWP31_1099 [Clostridia bacterium]|nr:hypothetical protein [Clostridia bacterium]
MNQRIHCTINNCHYWSQGNECKANEIIITSDQFGQSNPDKVDATMAKQLTPESADSCMSTCCKTFVPQGSGSQRVSADSIQKMS